jgi:hypothetical protein
MLLQHGADPKLRNTEGKTALDVADPVTRPVLSGNDYRKEELLEAARSGKMQTKGVIRMVGSELFAVWDILRGGGGGGQCFGSALALCGSVSSILGECGSGSSFENECGSGSWIQVPIC